MRNIKFRGKNILHKSWQYGSLAKDETQKAYYIIDNEYGRGIDVDENTIGLFTGLHDENGKEIYEGDIVYVASEDENAFILWDKETARYIIQFKGWCADFDNYYGKELEVIGNIYDNKDLLEKGAEE